MLKYEKPNNKRGCVFSMVIWPAFRMGQYRVNDHPYHAPQFSFSHEIHSKRCCLDCQLTKLFVIVNRKIYCFIS